jgi:uncharacterized protein YbjT (DUF2867 family)
MNVILFGATGMVGHGVLLECLEDPEIKRVLSLVRRSMGIQHPKLKELVRSDFYDYSDIEAELTGFDACFFCLGVSSAGMKEEDYRRITYDLTLAAAKVLHRLNPTLMFSYVSGAGTDSTEKGRTMWARVKGKTENDLLQLFQTAYMFRPGYIQPEKGVVSATPWLRKMYKVARPIGSLLTKFQSIATSTDVLGRAMIAASRQRGPSRVLDNREINAIGARATVNSA